MDKNSIIKSVLGQDDEKVGFSLKLPKSLKEELQTLCEDKGISMNALIVATLQAFLNDDCGKQISGMKRLLLSWRTNLSKEHDKLEERTKMGEDTYEIHEAMDELSRTMYSIDQLLGI